MKRKFILILTSLALVFAYTVSGFARQTQKQAYAAPNESRLAAPSNVAWDLVSSTTQNRTSFTKSPAGTFSSPGDCFDIRSRPSSLPFDIADDSNGTFAGDVLGIIDANDMDEFFCIVDLTNGDNPGGSGTATWVFDVSSATGGLTSLSIDMAAMGDFENADVFTWSYQLDAGAVVPIASFSGITNEALTQNYTMADGDVVNLADPMTVNGTNLINSFQTFSIPLTGTATTLTLTINATSDGPEGIAFRDIVIQGLEGVGNAPIVPTCPTTLTALENSAASTSMSATDTDSIVNNVTITGITPSDPGTISLSAITAAGAVGGTLTANLDASNTTPAGTYTVTLEFSNADPQTATCDVTVDIQSLTLIHDIQGSGTTVTGVGPFVVEAIVVGDFQLTNQLRGFFIQEEDADIDADSATSEGMFVYCNSCSVDVNVGDLVQVTGTASDFQQMSQLTATGAGDIVFVSAGNTLPTPAPLVMPVPTANIDDYYETFEGMLVNFSQTLTVAEYFELPRFGHLVLSNGRIAQYTDANLPTAPGYTAHLDYLAHNRIYLDDDNNFQNAPLGGNETVFHPVPGFSTTNYVRGGDTIANVTGVLHWSWAGFGSNTWRIRPVPSEFSYNFTNSNPRPVTPPPVGGTFQVASFNVLNYFTTLNSRGADTNAELVRQGEKIAAAICELDADVIGLMEIENNTAAIVSLINAISASCGTVYDYVDTGVVGTDEIKVALIYKPSTAALVGNYAILDSSFDPNFVDTSNRPAVAQTFEQIAGGGQLTVVVNHLKSKGSGCGVGDDDTTTGQGNCNQTRTDAAGVLVDWLATDPTGAGDTDFLIIGDLNAYRYEDPITAIISGGYTDMVDAFGGAGAYSYVFDGQVGYLDHALASSSLVSQITGAQHWNINADEASLLDYNDTIQDGGESSFERKPNALPLYEANAYRSSDHDPVLIGLNLTDVPPFVVSTIPVLGEPYAPADTNITIEFSEPVTVSGVWFQLNCTMSGIVTDITVSGGPTVFTLDPDKFLIPFEQCTLTIFASGVADQDGTVENMLANYATTFTVGTPANNGNGRGNVGVFDPALSKVGVLGPGEIGLTGETLTWTIIATNNGDGFADDVVVTDTLRSELRIDDVTTEQGSVAVSGQTVTFNLGTLAPGQAVTMQIVTTILSSPLDGQFTNTATLSGADEIVSTTAIVNGVTSLPATGYPQTTQTPSATNTLMWLLTMVAGLMAMGAFVMAFRQRLFR